MKRLMMFLFLVPLMGIAQNQIAVHIHDVPSSKGKINVAVYNSKDGFLKVDKIYKGDSIIASEGVTHMLIKDLPEGEYALAVFYDENGNDKLDTNWLGIPKEKVAFSKAKMRTFGPPRYKDCAFMVNKDTKIDVSL